MDISLPCVSLFCCPEDEVLSSEASKSLLKDELFELSFASLESLLLGRKRVKLKATSIATKTAAIIGSHRLFLSFGASIVCFSSNEVMQ